MPELSAENLWILHGEMRIIIEKIFKYFIENAGIRDDIVHMMCV